MIVGSRCVTTLSLSATNERGFHFHPRPSALIIIVMSAAQAVATIARQTILVTPAVAVSRPFTRIDLNRPKRYNAFSEEMYREVMAAMKESAADRQSRVTLISGGACPYYSAGNDNANFAKFMHPKTMAKNAKKLCYDFVDAFIQHPKPLVGVVNGPIVGIAATTMALCDLRIGVNQVTVSTPFKALGMAPEGCSSYMFPRLLGDAMAQNMLHGSGTINSGAEALKAGFLTELVDDNSRLFAVAEREALEIAEGRHPKVTQRFILAEPGLREKLMVVNQHEVDVLEKAWVSRECFQALRKFLLSKGKTKEATALRVLDATRLLWDR